jgi:hypothetical protein
MYAQRNTQKSNRTQITCNTQSSQSTPIAGWSERDPRSNGFLAMTTPTTGTQIYYKDVPFRHFSHSKYISTIGQHKLGDEIDRAADGSNLTLRGEILQSIKHLQWTSVDYIRTDWTSNPVHGL